MEDLREKPMGDMEIESGDMEIDGNRHRRGRRVRMLLLYSFIPISPSNPPNLPSIGMDICLSVLWLGRTTEDRFVTQRPLSVITRGYHADAVAPDLDLT